MNVYNLVFDAIVPVVLDKDVITLSGLTTPKGKHVYIISTLDFTEKEVILGKGYIIEQEFDRLRNEWHCYDVDTDTNMVILRRNKTIGMDEKWVDASNGFTNLMRDINQKKIVEHCGTCEHKKWIGIIGKPCTTPEICKGYTNWKQKS